MRKGRDEFPQKVKELLAKRAGYRCSAPNCSRVTVGPGEKGTKYANRGKACHIISASPNQGPRADPLVSKSYRQSIDNGIWLCSVHSDVIDSDYERYPVELLKRWKEDHELRMTLEVAELWVGIGIVHSLTVNGIAQFDDEQSLTFGPKTLILGENGSGKTCICDMVASLADLDYARKWCTPAAPRSEVHLSTVVRSETKWDIDIAPEKVYCKVAGVPIPSLYSGFRVYYFQERPSVGGRTDGLTSSQVLSELARAVGVKPDELSTALQVMAASPGTLYHMLRLDSGDDLKVQMRPGTPMLPFTSLSGSQQERVAIEVLLRFAEYSSQHAPTVLILDQHGFPTLSQDGRKELLGLLAKRELGYQLIVTMYNWPKDIDASGFRVYWLRPVAGDGTFEIVQDAKAATAAGEPLVGGSR